MHVLFTLYCSYFPLMERIGLDGMDDAETTIYFVCS